jgi:hypothetical protein
VPGTEEVKARLAVVRLVGLICLLRKEVRIMNDFIADAPGFSS